MPVLVVAGCVPLAGATAFFTCVFSYQGGGEVRRRERPAESLGTDV